MINVVNALVRSVYSGLAGVAAAYSMAPYDYIFLLFIGLSVFYWIYIHTTRPMVAFLYGFCFGLGYHVAGLWWVGNALLVPGNEYEWVWPLAVIGLPTALALFTGLFSCLAKIIFKKPYLELFGLAAFLTLAEWLRGHILTGFPWNLYGYGWIDFLPIMQTTSIIGPFGLTYLTLLWGLSGGFAYAYRFIGRHITVLICTVGSIALCWFWGQSRLDSNDTHYHNDMQVIVVQPNIPQHEKWASTLIDQNFEKHLALSKVNFDSGKATLIIWPETALRPEKLYDPAIKNLLQGYQNNAYLLTGTLQKDAGFFYNSLIAIDKNGQIVTQYHKSHLVPFGEYIPLQKWVPQWKYLKPVVDFTGFRAGNGSYPLSIASDIPSFTPLICYEAIFPHSILKGPMQNSEWILSITNDAWYGDSAGPHQHFAQAISRAIEFGMPVVRSANTGISGIIDPYGRKLSEQTLGKQATIEYSLPRAIIGTTWYQKWKDWPILLIIALTALCGFLVRKDRGHDSSSNPHKTKTAPSS